MVLQATGLYQHAGLDVEIKMGGPQINVMQLMAAGQADCTLGDNGQALETWQVSACGDCRYRVPALADGVYHP